MVGDGRWTVRGQNVAGPFARTLAGYDPDGAAVLRRTTDGSPVDAKNLTRVRGKASRVENSLGRFQPAKQLNVIMERLNCGKVSLSSDFSKPRLGC